MKTKAEELLDNRKFFSDSLFEKNRVAIMGRVFDDLEFEYERFGIKYYTTKIISERNSGNKDEIILIVPETVLDYGVKQFNRMAKQKKILIAGQMRSTRWHDENNAKHLKVFIFVTDFQFMDENDENDEIDENILFLQGEILDVAYRTTFNGIPIADILLVVKNPTGRGYKIPCIVWGRQAAYASKLQKGEEIQLHGRIQSREYDKRISETEIEKRIAYEVSAFVIKAIR